MPKGSEKSRFDNIANKGAQMTLEDVNYDKCVRIAAREAEAMDNGVVIQDTALTQMEVDPDDPAFTHPTKPSGAFMTKEEAERMAAVVIDKVFAASLMAQQLNTDYLLILAAVEKVPIYLEPRNRNGWIR